MSSYRLRQLFGRFQVLFGGGLRRDVPGNKNGVYAKEFWDVKTGELLLSFEQHGDIVVNGGFSPDGHRVVTASKDKRAAVFDADPKTRTQAEIVSVAERLAVSP